MITYQSPGVYIEEVPAGPQPVTAAPTSVMAIVGATRTGPFNEPTRVTGWTDFQRVFGKQVKGGYTALSVYGFFQNGGPAAYVVRADASVAATWRVLTEGGTEVLTAEATSPGSWANQYDIAVTPDTGAGSGTLYTSRVVLAQDEALGAGDQHRTLKVSSVVGVAVGDRVRLVTPTAAAVDATVTAVGESELTLALTSPGLSMPAGGTWVVAVVTEADTTLKLAAGTGFQAGDVLLAVTPTLHRASARVRGVAADRPGARLTLAAALPDRLSGGEFAPRVQQLTATLAGRTAEDPRLVLLKDLIWRETPEPVADDLRVGRPAVTAAGLTGTWNSERTRLTFPKAVPSGPVVVDVELAAWRFQESVTLDRPTRAVLTDRYGFVPDGTKLRLSRANPDADLTLTRDRAAAGGWNSAAEPDTRTWTRAEFLKPDDATKGVPVRSLRRPDKSTDFIELEPGRRHPLAAVESVDGHPDAYLVKVAGNAPVAVGDSDRYALHTFQTTVFSPLRFTLKVTDTESEAELERYTQLAVDSDHPRFFGRDGIVNGASPRIRVRPSAADQHPASDQDFPVSATRSPGADQPLTSADLRNAIDALEGVAEPAMVICPDLLTLPDELLRADVVGAMVRHCEEFRRFAIVDPPPGYGRDRSKELADWRGQVVNSAHAAVYAPYLRMADPDPDPRAAQQILTVPPSGFVAGVFARTDRERGVHKAPANERVTGIVGTAVQYTQRDQDLLNPAGVNLIRFFPGRNTRVWGARTSSDDVLWRYVSVRRLFNLIETSIERSTNWVVFEPNIQDTWLRVRVSVENFLDQLFRSGALAGSTPEEAYRVRIGLGETMTETDVDQGLVITEVAVAPSKPAEFVVFRFSHKRLTE